MGALSRLRDELDELTTELDQASQVPDAAGQPEVTRARACVDEARAALSSAFLSRRAMILAREAVDQAQAAVVEALGVSQVLRERSAALKKEAGEVRAFAAEAREVSHAVREWSHPLLDPSGPSAAGEVVIDSGIPEGHPRKQAIEAAVSQALQVTGGLWHAWITVPPGGSWWGLRVRGHSVDWICTLQGQDEQTPEAVAARLQPVVRLVLAEGIFRRRATLSRARRRSNVGDVPSD
jgi:hypothetical protein